MMKTIAQLTSMITCLLLILSLSIAYNGKILGFDLKPDNNLPDTVTYESDGTIVINTLELAKEVNGYGGNIPLWLQIKDQVITGIDVLEHSETPDFMEKVKKEMFPKYIGKAISDPSIREVDAVSGATLTSNAIKQSISKGLDYLQGEQRVGNEPAGVLSLKMVLAVLVILSASIVPLWVKSHKFRFIQLILNVAVLGLWCGSFISYSSLISFFSNGIMSVNSIVLILLLVVAFLYPVFNKKSHYCTWVCPLGSLQELAGKCSKKKAVLSQRTLKRLQTVRQVLWSFLMLFMWSGIFMDWVDYEPFSVFLFSNASLPVIIITVVFMLLSLITNRPYCRFICPTGTLLRISQNSKL